MMDFIPKVDKNERKYKLINEHAHKDHKTEEKRKVLLIFSLDVILEHKV